MSAVHHAWDDMPIVILFVPVSASPWGMAIAAVRQVQVDDDEHRPFY